MATPEQSFLIDREVEEVYDEYPTLEAIYKHNHQLGFQKAIIDNLSVKEADYIIKAFQKVKGYKLSIAFKILSKLI